MDYEKLKEVIAKQIKENGRREITGPVLQAVLMAMVDSLGEVYPHTYTDEQKAQARANIDALSNYDGEITKEKLSLEVQAILNDVANKQNITDATLATIAKTIVGAINELFNGGVKDASIATSKIKDGAITEDKLASQSVTNAKIANASVSEEKITDNSVSTEKLKDGAITEPKLDTDLLNIITSAVQPAELASAIATALASYVAKADIVDTTGSATDKVMSQHGVTEAINGVTNKVTDLAEKVNEKQDALTLTVKDNGNIVITNIQGQSKEFMPATPSGDPMHYAYEASGAKYNDTGADIIKTTPWADMVDDNADKTVVHKAGYWYVNGIGDITNEQMRIIFKETKGFLATIQSNADGFYAYMKSRVNLSMQLPFMVSTDRFKVNYKNLFRGAENLVAIVLPVYLTTYSIHPKDMTSMFNNCQILRHISGLINMDLNVSNYAAFFSCYKLRSIKLYSIKLSVDFQYSSELSSKSILYMIQNEAAKSAITITLHADAYARAMANADILAALEAHPNVSLASA